MMESNYINLERKRAFGEKLNATFEFIRLNFKPLVKAISYISIPAILPAVIIFVVVFSGIEDLITILKSSSTSYSGGISLLVYAFIAFISMALAYLLITLTTLEYLNIYREKKSSDIAVQEVWDRVKVSFKEGLLSIIILSVLGGMAYFVLVILMIVFAAIPVLNFFAIMGVMVGIMYVAVTISLYFNILINEKRRATEFIEILKRSFFLIRSKWWSTFGILFISGLIVGMTASLTSLPALLLGMGNELFSTDFPENEQLSSIITVMGVFYGINIFMNIYLRVIQILAVSFQYFNLVELKEAKGLMSEISSIDPDQESRQGKGLSSGDSEEDEDF